MGNKRTASWVFVAAGASVAALAYVMYSRQRQSRASFAAKAVATASTIRESEVDSSPHSADDVVVGHVGRTALNTSSDVPLVVGRVNAVDSPEINLITQLSTLPPLKMAPSMKLLQEHTDSLTDATASSSSDSTPENRTPRAPKDTKEARRKLQRVTELLDSAAGCLEKERHRVLENIPTGQTNCNEEKYKGMQWLEDIRRLETTIERLSLRKFVGASRSTTLTTRLCAEIGSLDGDELLTRLSSFSAFLFAKELVTEGNTGHQAKRLLFHALATLPAMDDIAARNTAPCGNDDKTQHLPVLVVFPVDENRPIHEPWLWHLAAQLLELQDGCVDALSEGDHLALPPLLDAAQTSLGLQEKPHSVAASFMALLSSSGNFAEAWMSLALSLDATDSIEVFGKSLPAVQAVAEAIRCKGGMLHCTSFDLWSEAAAVLTATQASTRQESIVQVTTGAHEPFLGHDAMEANRVPCSLKDCLLHAASLPESSEDADTWLQLGNQLGIGKSIEETEDGRKQLTVGEETATVAGMTVTRFDCYALSIAIDATNAECWYRVGVALDDKLRIQSMIARGDVDDVDSKVFERMIGGTSPVDRQSALLMSLKSDPTMSKTWFALATTLFERNNSKTQPTELQVRMPATLFGIRRRSVVRSSNPSSPSSPDARTLPFSPLSPLEFVDANAEDLFRNCALLQPSMDPIIAKWLQRAQEQSS